ncbi:MAG: LexA family protein [Limimaricola soesokkakensis]|uniref:LexA family protein n=1 Tax=Limimaricola soesokkakensis TaxID=1343159 RepID=UPI00405832F5
MTTISIDQTPFFESRRASVGSKGHLTDRMPILGLTPRQKQAFDFIRAEIVSKGISPSFDEIGAELGLASKGTVAHLVGALVDRGFITVRKRVSRSIALVDHSTSDAARLDDALCQIEALREALIEIEMRTATGEGLSPEEIGHIHMLAGIGRTTEATPGDARPTTDRNLPET